MFVKVERTRNSYICGEVYSFEMINMEEVIATLKPPYAKLLAKTKEMVILGTATGIIYWDMETKMPPKGVGLRSQQLALLSQMSHRLVTDPEIGNLLSKIEKHTDYESLSPLQKRNVYLIRKHYDEQTKLPEKLVKETAKQEAIAIDVWKKAKGVKDFSMFQPELEKMFDLRKQAADIFMEVKGTASPYDALIDMYEPQMDARTITKIFAELRDGLVSVMEKCRSGSKQPDTSFMNRKVPKETQERISDELAEFIGYDIKSPQAGGRIDETEHPFTGGYYDDVRITTHYYENNMASSLFSILHEGGHAIYDQNCNESWKYQPVGSPSSLGFHESQSRFVENMVGRSREFWSFFFPKLQVLTGGIFSNVASDDFVRAINQVKPSKIRVEADEVTYSLHVIIRFEIEQELLAGNITIKDLPELWNQKYKDYLGVTIENDSEGVMQDIHWASGAFGYFPTYALGNVYGGQILEILEGNFQTLKKWLVENVHQQGDLYDPSVLIKRIAGEEINVNPFLKYLNKKYSWIYGF
jgi:carboxypeptidase Taq